MGAIATGGGAVVQSTSPVQQTVAGGGPSRAELQQQMLQILQALKQIGRQDVVDGLLQALKANGITYDAATEAQLHGPVISAETEQFNNLLGAPGLIAS